MASSFYKNSWVVFFQKNLTSFETSTDTTTFFFFFFSFKNDMVRSVATALFSSRNYVEANHLNTRKDIVYLKSQRKAISRKFDSNQ
jgi:hypothetical protein